jgi:hypothetical protein
MSDSLTFAELEEQHVELLPARTVLSLFSAGTAGTPGANGHATPGIPGTPTIFTSGIFSFHFSGGVATAGTGGSAAAGH